MKIIEDKETYNAWIERAVAGREAKPLSPGEVVTPGTPRQYSPIEFVRVEKKNFVGEVGKRGDDYIFHLFPGKGWDEVPGGFAFEDIMGDVFLKVFQNPNQVEAAFTEEFGSWAIKVSGFANTVWGDDQALSIFEKLDTALSAASH
jgi:hypothetical protein